MELRAHTMCDKVRMRSIENWKVRTNMESFGNAEYIPSRDMKHETWNENIIHEHNHKIQVSAMQLTFIYFRTNKSAFHERKERKNKVKKGKHREKNHSTSIEGRTSHSFECASNAVREWTWQIGGSFRGLCVDFRSVFVSLLWSDTGICP